MTHTGYQLKIKSIQTKLNSYYLPEIVINEAKLTNPSNTQQKFSIHSVELVFSYMSIWHLEPIFNQIGINGTNINIEYSKEGKLLINGISINNSPNKSSNKFDFESWILKQSSIKLNHINFSFNDKYQDLPSIQLNNITSSLTNGFHDKHSFMLSLNLISKHDSSIVMKLDWEGKKIIEYDKWKSAVFTLQSYTNKNKISGTLRKYVPGLSILKPFNAKTEVEARLRAGKLQYLYTNFDAQNFQYILKESGNVLNLPNVNGNIQINLVNNHMYQLKIDHLTVSTPNGYVVKNKSINGQYNIGRNGQIYIQDINLKSFNNILALFKSTKEISINGTIDVISFNWLGKILHPINYEVIAKFNDLAIVSKNPSLPSIDGINGSLNIHKDKGSLNLSLKDSTLIYKPVFLIPYKFKHLNTNITWHTESPIMKESPTLTVNIGKTNIQTPDFAATLSGFYNYIPNTAGYLNLQARVNQVLTSKVGDYLPVQIGKDVHQWLNDGLIGGYGVNAKLDLQGPLNDFPFQDGKGRFYIDADIQNAKLLYVKDWPTLDNLYGKFKIRNQAIIIEATSGKVYGNDINHALVTIPDMTADNVDLIADGLASGSTPNFMSYLQKTPVNQIIGNLPDKLTTTGNGSVKLHLKVPFNNPNNTIVDGDYEFISNSLIFDLPVPPLSEVNGKLHFTDHGVQITQITANALDSQIKLSASTDKDKVMHFIINSPNLNYTELSKFYISFFSSLIYGRAPTEIGFDIGKNGISDIKAKSNLLGVKVNIPNPLNKESQETGKMDFLMLNSLSGFNINFNYNNLLNGKVSLDNKGNLTKTNLAVGSANILANTSNNPKVLVNTRLENTFLLDWLNSVTHIVQANKNIASTPQTNTAVTPQIASNANTSNSSTETYPIEVWVDTSHLYIGKTDFKKANIDLLVTKNNAIFAVNNILTDGYGKYDFDKNALDINANNFYFYQPASNFREQFNNESKIPFAALINNDLATKDDFNYLEANKTESANKIPEHKTESHPPPVNLPLSHININNFWYENQLIGKLLVTLRPNKENLIIESGILQGKTSKILFYGVNYCMECGENQAFVDMHTTWEINDLGLLLDHIGQTNTISKGKGTLNASIQWDGKLEDFDLAETIATINVDIKDGKFLKMDTTSGILAQLIGIMNLQYLYSFVNLSFGDVISNGFFFNKLEMNAYLINSKINIKSLSVWGATASVKSSGVIDLRYDTINLYLAVSPHLSTTVAVGVGVATLNPILGLLTYGAELLLDSPVNKLFTFGFHISGLLSKPTIEQIDASKQVISNVTSTVGQ